MTSDECASLLQDRDRLRDRADPDRTRDQDQDQDQDKDQIRDPASESSGGSNSSDG